MAQMAMVFFVLPQFVFPLELSRLQTQTPMKKIILTLAIVAAFNLALMADDAKSYQVTGPVLEVNASYIVVQKGDQKWQIAWDSSTKGDKPKVGDKVTIYYKMTATEIETKPAKK
jgi:hypothetical protein